jgi:iron complex outermembrane receptor protein
MKRLYFYKLSILSLALLFSFHLSSQAQVIQGIIKDAATKQPVGFCNILILNTHIGVVANADGHFKINIPPNSQSSTLTISAIGYAFDTLNVSFTKPYYEIFLMAKASILNDIVVSGSAKAVRIRENPITIVAVGIKQIEQSSENNVIDAISKNAPGLQTVKTGPNVSKPFINGLGYNRVLTLYDGLRVETQQWGDEHGVPMDDYIIDRAEVIEGPASLLYGSDAIAGVLSLFPNLPKYTDGHLHGRYLSEYQSNNGLIGNSLILNYAKTHWSWALRGSQRLARSYTNPVDGRVYNTGFKMYNGSAFMGYNGAKGYSHFNVTVYDNRQGIPDGSRDSLSRKFTYQVYESEGENVQQTIVDNIKDRPVVPNNVLNSYSISPLSQRIQDYRIYTDNFYTLGKGDIKASLGYEQNIRREFDHPTDTKQAGEYILLNTIDYGLRYNAPSFLNIEPSIGVNGMYQTNTNKNATDFPIPAYHLFDAGAYVYGKWKYNAWTIAGGVRYDHRSETGDQMYIKPNSATGFFEQIPLNDSAQGIQQFSPFTLHLHGITGSIGITYEVNEHISLKANIGRGYRTPNITELASNGLDPGAHIVYKGDLQLKPEFSLQEDAGVIGTYNDVSFGVSVFNNYIQNYIYEDQEVDANGNPVVIIPGNKTFKFQHTNAQLYGLNATLNIHPTNSLKAFNLNNSVAVVYGFNKNPKLAKAGVDGEYLPFIPPPRWLSTLSYDIDSKSKVIKKITLKTDADINLAQNRYLGENKTETPTAAYTLWDASANIEINYSKKQTIQFQLAVNNILNTAYQSHLSRLQYFEYYKLSPNGHFGIYNMGRNFCIKAIVPF